MAGTDDLAPLLTPGQQPPPYAQGVIKQFNSETFENVIRVHERDLVNLPVKSSVEALTYQPGDTVILARWPGSRQGMATWWIDGRAVIPGTGRGEEAIAFMTTALGEAVARSVIGNSVFFSSDGSNADVNYPSGGFVDPDSGTVGPSLVDIEIGPSGRAIVTIGASIIPIQGPDPTGFSACSIGYEVSGETSVLDPFNAAGMMVDANQLGAHSTELNHVSLVTDLNEGLHTFTAKYLTSVISGSGPTSARFADRYIQVIAF